MKVTITHLKAPWPEGAGVGSVVDVGDTLPGCFAGKCTEADADAEVQFVYEPKAPPEVAIPPAPLAGADQAEVAAQLHEAQVLLAAEREHTADLLAAAERLQTQVLELTTQRDDALAKAAQAAGEIDALRAAQAEAAGTTKAGSKART